MKEEQLKNIWNMLGDRSGTHDVPHLTTDKFIKSRSDTLQEKVRRMVHHDLLLKLASSIAFTLNILFYIDTLPIVYFCIAGMLFLVILTYVEWTLLKEFNLITDPGLSTRESLSGLLVYLRRKGNLIELTIASSQFLIFVPGLLLYFFIAYGYLKPMTGFSFFVFSGLALIGTTMSYLRTRSQLGFLVKHLTMCLSDLNENTMGHVYGIIEDQRKKDHMIKILVALALILGFVVLVGILKSVVG